MENTIENFKSKSTLFRDLVNNHPTEALKIMVKTIESSILPYSIKGMTGLQVLHGANGVEEFYNIIGEHMSQNEDEIKITLEDDEDDETKMYLGMFTQIVNLDNISFVIDMTDSARFFDEDLVENLSNKTSN